MKQTAVEWLAENLEYVNWMRNRDEISAGMADEWRKHYLEQAKAMEEEQMVAFAEFVATYTDKNININGEMLHAKSKYDGAERTIDLLVTFKAE